MMNCERIDHTLFMRSILVEAVECVSSDKLWDCANPKFFGGCLRVSFVTKTETVEWRRPRLANTVW